MIAIQVKINKQKVVIAAVEQGVVSCTLDRIIDSKRDQINFRLGGLNSINNEIYDWLLSSLAIGDKIEIQIIDTAVGQDIDKPVETRKVEELDDAILESKKKSYLLLKKELEDRKLI